MQIAIKSLEGQECTVALEDVGPVYRADDVIYFSGVPYVLSSAHLTPHEADSDHEQARRIGIYTKIVELLGELR